MGSFTGPQGKTFVSAGTLGVSGKRLQKNDGVNIGKRVPYMFSLDCEKIGAKKWLSNPGPGGICQIVKIYELEGDGSFWNLTETRVTAGETKGPLCEGVTEELNKPTLWTWKNPSEWELPCDFISHNYK